MKNISGSSSIAISKSIGKYLHIVLLQISLILIFTGNAFAINVPNGSPNTMACNGVLYDPGGTSNYGNSSSGYTVIAGKTGATINIAGTYDLESGCSCDFIRIYSGAGTGGTLRATYTNGTGNINYTGTSGETLTVLFTSDGSATRPGFQVNVNYSTGGTCPTTTLVSGAGTNSVSCGNSALLLDHAGEGIYGNNRNDYTVLNSIGSAAINISGAYALENCNCDYLRIYSGSGTGGTVLQTFTATAGVVNYTGSPGQTLTVGFTSDANTVRGGFSLMATYSGSCSVPYEATYVSMSTGSSTWCAGETRNVTVTLQNTGSNAWADGGGEDFNIGVKWNADPDYLVRVDALNLAPGASQTYTFTVTAPAAGSNNLSFGVVREGVAWFGGPFTSAAQTIITTPSCASTSLAPANGATGICYAGQGAVSSISWGAVSGATGYDVYFGTSGTPPLVSTNQAGLSYATGALAASQTYYWRIVPRNSCGTASSCGTWSFTTAAQPCYCQPVHSSGGSTDQITGVVLAGNSINLSNTPTGQDNYTFYSALNKPDLAPNSAYTLSVTFGSHGTQYYRAWIDYNQNGVFEASEALYTGNTAAGGNATVNIGFTVPPGALGGTTRMRVRGGDDTNFSTAQACDLTDAYGETEDYLVTICTAPTSFTVSGGGCVNSGNVVLSGSQSGVTYSLLRDGSPVTTTPGNGSAIDWGVQTFSGTYTVQASGGAFCALNMGGSAVLSAPAPVNGTISVAGGSGCQNAPVTVTPSGGSGTPWYWVQSPAGTGTWNILTEQAPNGSGNSFTFTPTSAGSYRIQARWKEACGFCTTCTHPYTDITVNVPPSTGPTNATASPSSLCAGATVTLTATGSGASYRWYSASTGGSLLSSANPFVTTATGSGVQSIYAALVDANGCEAATRFQVNVTVTAAPALATSPVPANAASGVCATGTTPVTTISWTGSAATYDVYFGAGSLPGSVTSTVSTTSYTTGALAPNTTYYWRIVPKNGTCVPTGSPSTWTFTTAPALGTPTVSAPSAFACNSFTANWATLSGATSYRLDVSLNSGFSSNISGYNNLTVAGTSQSVTGLSAGTTYYYRVRAVDACGNVSANSTTQTATTSGPSNDACASSTGLTINAAATTGNVVCAAAGSGACGGTTNYDVWYSFTPTCVGTYQVLVDPSASFDAVFQLYGSCGGSNLSPISGTSGTDACVDQGADNSNEYATYSLAANTTYYVRVYDYNGSGLAYPSTTDFTIAVSAVSISIPGTPSAITGPTSVCPGSQAVYSVTNVSGVTYTWSIPSGWSGSSNTNSITVTASSTTGAGTISVTAGNSCGTSSAVSKSVSSGPVPIAEAGANTTISCAGAVRLGASSTNQIIATEDFGSTHAEVTSATSGWRLFYYGSDNDTEWWISNAANGFTCAIGGSSLSLFDTQSTNGPIKCDYSWNSGVMDEVAYRVAEIDAALYTKVYLTFDYSVSGDMSSNVVYDYMQVVYSTDGGASWTPVNAGVQNGSYTFDNNNGVNNGYFSIPASGVTNTTIELPSALAGNRFQIGFRWRNDGSIGLAVIPGMVVDNIVVHGTADYAWSGGTIAYGANTPTPVVTQAGTYTVTVTAGNGCTATDNVVLTQTDIDATVTATNVITCGGQGTINITNPTNGSQPWNYAALSSAAANTSIVGNATYTGGRLRLTSAVSQGGTLIINNPSSFNAGAVDLDFDLFIGNGTSADGFSISYGSLSGVSGGNESGFGNELKISFDTYSNGTSGGYQFGGTNAPGIYLVYGSTVLAYNSGTAWRGMWRSVRVSINSSNQLTLYIDGVSTLTYNLGTTAYASANKSTWTWALSGRTGGAYDEHSIRNLLLTAHNQYEYSVGSGWGTISTFNVNAGGYTPQLRLKGGLCTKNLTAQTITAPPILPAIPSVTNNGPVCSGTALTLTASGTAPGGKVANFATGSSQTTSSGLLGISNTFTMEFWVKPTATRLTTTEDNNTTVGTSNQRYAIFAQNAGADAGMGVSVGTNGISVFEHGSGYMPSLLVYDFPSSMTNWMHVAVVYNNRTPSLYINGVFVKTGIQGLRSTVYPSTGTGGSYGYYEGQLDAVRIWNDVRTPTEIRDNMHREVPANNTGLVVRYDFNASNTNASFGSPNNTNGGATFVDADYYTYSWAGTGSFSPNSSATSHTSAVTGAATGNYTVTYNTANNCGAVTGGTTAATVNANPTVTITPTTPTVCNGLSATLTASGGTGYAWSSGDNTAATTVTPATTTSYTVTVTDANSCTSTGSRTVTVTQLTISGPTFQAGDYVFSGRSSAGWATPSNWYVYNGSSFAPATVLPTTSNNVYVYPTSVHSCIALSSVDLQAGSFANNVNIMSGGTINGTSNSQNLTVHGNWNNAGTYTAGNSTVTMGGSVNTTASAGSSPFYRLVVNKATNAAKVQFLQNFECTNELTLTRGTVEIPQDVVGETPKVDIATQGNLILKQKTNGTKGGELQVQP